jgi:hypothetical protein
MLGKLIYNAFVWYDVKVLLSNFNNCGSVLIKRRFQILEDELLFKRVKQHLVLKINKQLSW